MYTFVVFNQEKSPSAIERSDFSSKTTICKHKYRRLKEESITHILADETSETMGHEYDWTIVAAMFLAVRGYIS